MFNVAVIASGGGTNLQALIDAIKCGTVKGARLAVVIADNENAFALTRARENGIPNFVIKRHGNPDFEMLLLNILEEHEVDIIVLAGFIGILKEAVHKYPDRIINIHPSLLPRHSGMGYYGIKVHESVLQAGDRQSGATAHYVNEAVDGGEIILQKEVKVCTDDTPQSLQQRVLRVEWEILPKALQIIINKLS